MYHISSFFPHIYVLTYQTYLIPLGEDYCLKALTWHLEFMSLVKVSS